EKIHPQAFIEDLARNEGFSRNAVGRASQPAQATDGSGTDGLGSPSYSQLNLFADFNGLAEKEGLKGKVQTIYPDPPYGIKFGSNWQVSTRKRDVKDGKAEDASRQPEQVKAFRDTWQLGIHSYLAFLRDRLVVARELLTETGSIFVQIGDENVHLERFTVT